MLPSSEISKEEAVKWFGRRWWMGLDAKTVALTQLRQKRLCMPFEEFHAAVEAAAGCPVWTHEFAEPERLIAMIEGGTGRTESPIESAQRLAPGVIAVERGDG